jgi:hypothetical protein
MNDSPEVKIPLTLAQHATVQPADNVLIEVEAEFYFTLNVASMTLDPIIDSQQVYTQAATAKWSFNADGSIGNAASGYLWTTAGVGITVENKAWQKGSGPLDIPPRNSPDVTGNNSFS